MDKKVLAESTQVHHHKNDYFIIFGIYGMPETNRPKIYKSAYSGA